MSIANVPYINPTLRGKGVQSDGVAWLPGIVLDFTGWTIGAIGLGYTFETYAGLESWSDGSKFVAQTQKLMEPWRLRNKLRGVKAELKIVMQAIQEGAAEENGGVVVVDPDPGWMDEPMEPDPNQPPAPEPQA